MASQVVSSFILALLICACRPNSDKDFSFSFLPEDEGEQEMSIKQEKELKADEVDARRGLQTQLLAEAKKVEEAVKRLGSLRRSDNDIKSDNDMKQGVVVSKAGALLLCSLFPDKSELPDYCEGANVLGKVRAGVDSDEDAARNSNDDISVTRKDQDVNEKKERGTKESAIVPKNEQQQIYNNQGISKITSVPHWLWTLGFESFLQPQQGPGQSYGRPAGSYHTPSPSWYHNQHQVSPYQPYQQHLQLAHQYPRLPIQTVQQPAQHLHLHLPQGNHLPSTSHDCQSANFFFIEGKKFFLCQSGSSDVAEKDEGVKTRQKRNSMMAWPFPAKV